MKYIDNELIKLQTFISKDFIDPIPNNDLRSFLLGSSKRIRSTLALYFLKSFNIEISDAIYKVLSVGEIIHNASLLHDDVIDNAKERRGVTTIGQKYSDKISILSGDYLLNLAINRLLDLENNEILNIFQNCTKTMIESEIKQFFLRGNLPSEKDYIDICIGKTAVLFSTILECCAILTKLPRDLARNFGQNFGICFQINNDLEQHSFNNDKENGVYTAIDILGFEKTSTLLDNYKSEIENLILNIPENIYKERLKDLYKKL